MDKIMFCTDGKIGSEHCPGAHDIVEYYTQITLNGQCVIPEPKPDSEKLVGKYYTIDIRSAKTIDTIEFDHGQRIEGKKVVFTGTFNLDIEYLDNHPAQNVHYFECKVPFNAVIIPCLDQREYLFPPEFKLEDYIVHACVEHIRITWISERIFERAIILMIWLQKSN